MTSVVSGKHEKKNRFFRTLQLVAASSLSLTHLIQSPFAWRACGGADAGNSENVPNEVSGYSRGRPKANGKSYYEELLSQKLPSSSKGSSNGSGDFKGLGKKSVTALIKRLEQSRAERPKLSFKAQAQPPIAGLSFGLQPPPDITTTTKATLRPALYPDPVLQAEFVSFLRRSFESKVSAETKLKNLENDSAFIDKMKQLTVINERISSLLALIYSKHKFVPVKARKTADKFIETKANLIKEIEQLVHKTAVASKLTAQQQRLLQECESGAAFYVSNAHEALLGNELFIPKNKPMLLVDLGQNGATAYLGFLYCNEAGRTRLVRSMRPLCISDQSLIVSQKGIEIADGDPNICITLNNADQIKANILQVLMNKHMQKGFFGQVNSIQVSPCVAALVAANDPSQILNALKNILVREPDLIHAVLGVNGLGPQYPYNSPQLQFIQAFLPGQKPVHSILNAYFESHIRELAEAMPKSNVPDGSMLSPSGQAQNNLYIKETQSTSFPGMKLLTAFICQTPHIAEALKQTTVQPPVQPQPLLRLVMPLAINIANNFWNQQWRAGLI